MTDHAPEADWTRSPARPLGALVLMALILVGLLAGWSQGRSPATPIDRVSAAETHRQPRLIDVNHASAAELDLLPGIGPKRAAAIIEERTHAGPFRSLEDLERVHGIGPRTVEKLRGIAGVEDSETDR